MQGEAHSEPGRGTASMPGPGPCTTAIYLDANATIPTLPIAMAAYRGACASAFNPSSTHLLGQRSAVLLEDARRRVAAYFDRAPKEIIFTSGATEANALALNHAYGGREKSPLVICSGIEHPSVLATLEFQARHKLLRLEKCVVPIHGRVRVNDMLSLLPAKNEAANVGSITLSLICASNETGVVQDVPGLAEALSNWSANNAVHNTVVLHTDAVQAIGRLAHMTGTEAEPWRAAHRISISGHKLGAMPGIGALIAADATPNHNAPLVPIFSGGAQERALRAGTENIAGAISLATALEHQADATETLQLEQQRTQFEHTLQQALGPNKLTIIGGTQPRLPQTSLLQFHGCHAEAIMMALDMRGIACSTGSACSAGSTDPSPVLLSMGYSKIEAKEALRLSFPRVLHSARTMRWLTTELLDVVRAAEGLA